MAETVERVYVNRIGEVDSYSLGFVSAKRSGRPRSERQLSCNKTLEGARFRFIFASFVVSVNLQLLEYEHKMATCPIYGRLDTNNAREDWGCAHRSQVL